MTETYTKINGQPTINKDTTEILDYTFDWTSYLLLNTDTIASFTITPDVGLTLVSSNLAVTLVTCFLSGGIAGAKYRVKCTIVTTGGRTATRSIYIQAAER